MLCYTLIHHSTITDTAHLLIFGLPAVRMVSPYKLSLGTFVLYVYRAELLMPYSARKPNNFTGREIIFQLPGKLSVLDMDAVYLLVLVLYVNTTITLLLEHTTRE